MKKFSLFFSSLLIIFSCEQHTNTNKIIKEDRGAKKMLQGIWINEDGEDVVFKVKGDTIYYPDTTSLPTYFQIVEDSLILQGASENKYHIQKQTENLFIFENQAGEQITLTKSNDTSDNYYFSLRKTPVLNQCQLIKRDSIVNNGDIPWHYYIQVNPTTYKVIKTMYNDEGVGIDNIYYDNIIHLSVYIRGKRIYSSNFSKHDLKGLVPAQYLSQSILSDIEFYKSTPSHILFIAYLRIPDTSTSYQINIIITSNGKRKMQILV